MLSFLNAQAMVREAAAERHRGVETVPLAQAPGRVCAESILAPLTIPSFANAAMDGYALRREALARASTACPVSLPCVGVLAAGDSVWDVPLGSDVCVQIMTGAPMPPGADAVVPVEQVERCDERVLFSAPIGDKTHVRQAGEDFQQGQGVLSPAEVVTLAHVLPLATLGIGAIAVFKKLRVVVLSTGRELVDDLSAPLASGQIYNSNQPYACAFLEAMGAQVLRCETIPDDAAQFARLLSEIDALAPDLVVSSGAVSAGAFDFVPEQLLLRGAQLVFHKLKLKPGKPNLFARLRCGALYFGLPGNPVAVAVALRFLVEPAVRSMMGRCPEKPLCARVLNGFERKPGFHLLLKGQLMGQADGVLAVEILAGQESFQVSPFLRMNAWVSVPEDLACLRPGDTVDVFPLAPTGGLAV